MHIQESNCLALNTESSTLTSSLQNPGLMIYVQSPELNNNSTCLKMRGEKSNENTQMYKSASDNCSKAVGFSLYSFTIAHGFTETKHCLTAPLPQPLSVGFAITRICSVYSSLSPSMHRNVFQ